MFNGVKYCSIKENYNIKALYRAARRRNEKIWTAAIDRLIELEKEVEWDYLFSKLTQEKRNYCINMLIHRMAIDEYKEKSLNVIKKIGEAALPAVLDAFYSHVTTISTTEDFEKLQDWLNELLSIVVYSKPPEAVDLFIKVYEQSSNQDVRDMVLEYLGQLDKEEGLEFIQKQLADESIYVRAAAIRALGLTRYSEVVPIIVEELHNNTDSSLYVRACLEALVNIGDAKCIEILSSYLHKDIEWVLKEKIAEALLKSPYIEINDIEDWFSRDDLYEVQEILIKVIAKGGFAHRISPYIIKCVTKLCLASYGKGSDMFTWGIELLRIKEKDALQYLMTLMMEEEYKDLPALDVMIGEFWRKAFPYLKAIYSLADTYESKSRIMKLMAKEDSLRLTKFLAENIDDICSLLSVYIQRKDEEKIFELIDVLGNALNKYSSIQKAFEPIVTFLLSKCQETDYSDEERFYIKILFHLYKYFYLEELEDFFIMYLDGSSPFWRYAVKALEYHETDKARKILVQYASEKLYNNEEVIEEAWE